MTSEVGFVSAGKSPQKEERRDGSESQKWAPFAPSSHAASIGWRSPPVTAKEQVPPSESRERPSPNAKAGKKRPRPFTRTSETTSATVGDDHPVLSGNEGGTASDTFPVAVTQTWTGNKQATLTFPRASLHMCLIGRARLEIIQGQVEVLGLLLGAPPLRNTALVDSPTWKSAITIVSMQDDSIVKVSSVATMANKDTENKEAPATFDCCTPLTAGAGSIRPTIIPPTWELAMNDIVADFFERSRVTKNLVATKTKVSGSRVVICGAKGVGKSTFLRYAANRLLSSRPTHVAVLDCDVGQPEMSPPGMLTLTVIASPLLHPPHVHMVRGSRSVSARVGNAGEATSFVVAERHVAAYFYGHALSKADPAFYMECINKLVERYKRLVNEDCKGDENRLPLLVNTDGWVKGMGFQLLSALVDLVQPLHIVQLMGEVKSKIFDLYDTLSSSSALVTTRLHVVAAYNNSNGNSDTTNSKIPQNSPITAASRVSSIASFASVDVNADVVQPQIANATSIPALALRSLRLCTYFLDGTDIFDEFDDVYFGSQGICDFNCRIASRIAAMKPYAVPMSSVTYDSVHGYEMDRYLNGDNETALDALNGSIVGLCTSSTDDMAGGKGSYRLPCVGLGMIRSIDRVRQLFFILTPVHKDDLQSVRVLVAGSIQIPLECMYRGIESDGFPNLCCDGISVGIGAEFMKSRNSLQRKSLIQ